MIGHEHCTYIVQRRRWAGLIISGDEVEDPDLLADYRNSTDFIYQKSLILLQQVTNQTRTSRAPMFFCAGKKPASFPPPFQISRSPVSLHFSRGKGLEAFLFRHLQTASWKEAIRPRQKPMPLYTVLEHPAVPN